VLVQVGYAREALTFAETLAEARAALRDQAFAMALVDLGLPDGNGVDLIREVRDTDAALPMLVISTWSTERIIVGAPQAGATEAGFQTRWAPPRQPATGVARSGDGVA